jgi:hypothetical protein
MEHPFILSIGMLAKDMLVDQEEGTSDGRPELGL